MFNQKNLNSAKLQLNHKDNDYQEALLFLEKFNHKFEKDYLKHAAIKLFKSLEKNRLNSEAYLCLAYIYYVLKQDDLCMKYLKIAETISPDLLSAEKFRKLICGSHLSVSPPNTQDKNPATAQATTKIQIKTIARISKKG